MTGRTALAAGAATCAGLLIALLAWFSRPRPGDLVAGGSAASGPVTEQPGLVIACPDQDQRAACLAMARRHGMQVDYPRTLAHIPRYEAMDMQPGLGERPALSRLAEANFVVDFD
jgi:hypothetical protein